MSSHNLTLASTDPPPIIRCKSCRVPLPDATWKNCDTCRRNRTENYRRYRQSAQLRLRQANTAALQLGRTDMNPSTSSQGPGSTAPVGHHPNKPDHRGNPAGSSRPANQPPTKPAPTARQLPQAIEYQTSDELLDALSELPPRSKFVGKFSVVADPAVNNSMRTRLFTDQLRARAIPISKKSQPVSSSGSSYSLVFSCACQEACQGQFIVSVDDDTSHPYGVPGQRIGAVVLHPGLSG